ncbi:hypothetical protein Taro_008136 [Colocasia esculenta]|uniref:Uncharacterized protein n=1 Tax=Colocasia esculenta TaxID=4460 RepID=A0A843TWT1_COLES|nr:hypothetical protein [Colocasia esculenta]
MRGKDVSKPVFVKKEAANTTPTFRNINNNNHNNNTFNNNNKRPNAGRYYAMDKKVKVEGRQLSKNCKFFDTPEHRVEECWKKLGACLRCGGRDHRIPDYPMLKDQPGKAQTIPRHQGRLNAVVEADLPEEGGMVEGTILIHSQPAFVLIDTGAGYSFISTTFTATLPVKPVLMKSKIIVASPLGSKPIGTNAIGFAHFLGSMARNSDLLPIDVFDWRYMQEHNINECLELVKSKYELEDCHENYVVASLSKKWKD